MVPGPNENPGNGRGTDRNRRVSVPLSPIFPLFLAPSGILYLKVQDLLAHDEAPDGSPPAMGGKRRPGPKHPTDGLPTEHWPMIIHRVVEKNEPSPHTSCPEAAWTARSVTVQVLFLPQKQDDVLKAERACGYT